MELYTVPTNGPPCNIVAKRTDYSYLNYNPKLTISNQITNK